MKKNYFKKSLSLLMTVLMIMSCWVFFPGMIPEAEAATVSISYPVTLNTSNHSNTSKGGYARVYYYQVNEDGSLDTSNTALYTDIDGSFANGLSTSLSATIAGFPWKLQIYCASSGTDKCSVYIDSFYVGSVNVLNGWSGTCKDETRTWYMGQTLDSISLWPQGAPSWTASVSGSISLQVPTYGTRTAGTITASIFDEYGVSWPTDYITFSHNGSNITLNKTNNTATATVGSEAISNFSDSTGKKTVTVTASGAGVSKTASLYLTAPTKDVLYENLFSLSDWYYSNSSKYNDSYVVTNVSAGTIKITNASSSEYVTNANTGTHTSDMYSMPVTGGKTYYFTWTTAGATSTEVFFMWKDVNGAAVADPLNGNSTVPSKSFSGNGTHWAEFTAPSDATQVELRFDNNTKGTTVTYSDIAVYDKTYVDSLDLTNWPTRPVRATYTYNSALGSTLSVPSRIGYSFDGWYIDYDNDNIYNNNDVLITDGNGAVVSSLQSFAITQNYTIKSRWTAVPYDIGFDNIFSLAEWSKTGSTSPDSSNGTITYDVDEGTITAESTANGEVYSQYGSNGYTMDVEPSTEYVFEVTAKHETTASYTSGTLGQMFIFCYDANGNSSVGPYNFDTGKEAADANGNLVQHIGKYFTADGTYTIKFRTPANCYKLRVRVGSTSIGVKTTFSDIGIYEKSVYDDYAGSYTTIREPYYYGDTTEFKNPPAREGWLFNGWVDGDGNAITSVTGMHESDVVYATWIKKHKVTFLNAEGEAYKTVEIVDGNSITSSDIPDGASVIFKDSDENAHYDFDKWTYNGAEFTTSTAITGDMEITPTFTAEAHSIAYEESAYKAQTCETNAIVGKYCDSCWYDFGQVEYDGTTETDWLKYGHNFEGQAAVVGTSSGNTDSDTHELECVRYGSGGCTATTRVVHTWNEGSTTGANCITPGTVHWSCACGAAKTTEGVLAPSVHENTKKENYVAATCTTAGKEYDTYCNDCKQTIETGAEIPAPGHTVVTDAAVEATCTETGLTEGSHCSVCKEVLVAQTVTKALGHTVVTDAAVEATCTNTGLTEGSHCSRCNEIFVAQTVTDALGHKFDGAYVSNNNGTHTQKCTNTGCTATGNEQTCTYGAWDTTAADTHSKTCQYCSYVYTENHDWSAWTSTDSTKAEAGTMTRYCTICRKEVTDDCNYTVTADVKETCTTAAYKTYTCSDCDHGYTVIGNAATGHDYTGEYKFNSTSDVHIQLCKNGCGKYGSVVDGVQTDNKWVDCSWTYANKADGTHAASCACGNSQDEACTGGEATCTKPAVCEKCNTGYGSTAPHTFEGTAVALDGDVHAYRCKYCDDQTIYGVGENQGYTEGCSGGTATCTDKAECAVCSDTHGELNADNHKWINATNVSGTETHTYTCEYNSTHTKTEDCYSSMPAVAAPDCNTAGYTLNTCDYCNHTWQTNPTDALGHDWSAWVNNEDGTHTRTCERGCGYDDNEETVDCTKDNATSVITAPTCLDQGYTTYTCKDCGYVWEDDYVNATGHSYTDKTKNATAAYLRSGQTCTTALTYWYKCDNCAVSAGTEKDKYDDESALYWVSKEAKSHSFTNKDTDENYLASEATCTEKAVYYYSCANCGASSKDIDNTTFTSGTALGHNWTDTETYKKSDADCVNNEVYYKECSRCNASSENVTGDTWTKEGTLKGHDFDHDDDGAIGNEGDTGYVAYKAATCAEEGVLEHYTCETCNKMFSDEAATAEIYKTAIAALGHNMINVARKAATCEEDGYTAHKACSRCGERNSDYKVIDAKGHDFSGAYYCDSVHNYHAKYCVNTDCTAYGLNGIKYTVKYNENDEAVITGGEPCVFDEFTTSTVDGVHSHNVECDCGNASVVVIGSDNITTKTVAATCTADGYTLNTCIKDDCGESWKTNITEKLGHDLTGTATSNGNGTHSVKCSREDCGYSADADKCSTATPSTSCGERNTCDTCLGVFGDEIEHVFTNYVYNNDATCESDGTKTAECDNCDTDATETVTATGTKLGHDYTDYIYDVIGWTNMPKDFDASTIKEPTCGEEGLSISYCTRCDSYKTKPVAKDKNAHNMPEEWTLVGGDCSTGVTYVRECTICGDKEAKTEKVPHDWKAIAIVQAGCTTNGFIEFECTACGFTETLDETTAGFPVFEGVDYTDKNIVAKGAHTWQTEAPADADYMMIDGVVVFVEKYPAYNATGRGYKKCTLCSTTEKVVIDAYGNNPEDHKHPELGINDNSTLKYVAEVEPTCTVGGHKGYWECTRCSYSEYVIDHDAFYIAPYGHTQANSKGKCDRCQTVLEENDASKNCGCICHKTGFMKFIYSILKFFWKIFGMNKTCDCGAVHY